MQRPGEAEMKELLHVGCSGHPLPAWLTGYRETRLDIDPGCKPDIVASMTDLGAIGPFDMIFCSHALEHVYPHQVPVALSEFIRVLKPGGAAVVLVPDLGDVRPTDEVLYRTDDGPVTGLDLIYGIARTVEASLHWAHHTGFTAKTMADAFNTAGFSKITVKRLELFNILAVGIK
jgi:predicted SAM-dependent methyltransferase